MLHTYIVAYDVSEDRRRLKIYSYLRGWGDHLQYSVFRVMLSPSQLDVFTSKLWGFVHQDEDQVLVFDLGPTEGRAKDSVISIGMHYTHPERHAVVV